MTDQLSKTHKIQSTAFVALLLLALASIGLNIYYLKGSREGSAEEKSIDKGTIQFTLIANDPTLFHIKIGDKSLLSAHTTNQYVDIFGEREDKARFYTHMVLDLPAALLQANHNEFIYFEDYKTKHGVKLSVRDLLTRNTGRIDISFGNRRASGYHTAVSFVNIPAIWAENDSVGDVPVEIHAY